MKVAIVTAMWKRPHVFRIFAENTNRLIASVPDIEFKVFVAGSEGETSKALAERFGFNYVEVANDPLWNKWNAATRSARSWKPDHVLMMGSDDIMDADMFRNYIDPMRERVDFIGCTDWMFYDMATGRSMYWGGYVEKFRKGETVGAGRMFSSRLLNMMDWQPWQAPVDGEGMDGTMMRKLRRFAFTKHTFKMGKGMGVDIKSSTNITKFQKWPNSRYIRPEILKQRFIGL